MVASSKSVQRSLSHRDNSRCYWWVNQNQTFEEEINGGYMWSPKTKKNGAYNEFYDNMRRVRPGDIVFSFRRQYVSYIGLVTSPARDAKKPFKFEPSDSEWLDEGWRVDVVWTRVPHPIRPKDHFEQLRPHLAAKYAPLSKKTGSGLQAVYLAAVSKPMADLLLALTQVKEIELPQKEEVESLSETQEVPNEALVERLILQDDKIPETEKKALITARIGQGKFRQNVEAIEEGCRITGVTDKRLLRASHIKPWARCGTNEERLDGENGFLEPVNQIV